MRFLRAFALIVLSALALIGVSLAILGLLIQVGETFGLIALAVVTFLGGCAFLAALWTLNVR